MGISINYLWYLSDNRLLRPKTRLLDIGSSYLYNVRPNDVLKFAACHGGRPVSDAVANDIANRSAPKAGRQMLFLSELLDHTDIDYVSYDVCPGAKTELFDLNRQELAPAARGSFDVVLNFGTSEHVINQVNTFKTIHEALKPGGIAFHQSPSIGWVDHGYFCYHPRFYDDLRIANAYEEIDKWYARTSQCTPPNIDFRDEERPQDRGSGSAGDMPHVLPCCNLNVLHRKLNDAPFQISLELSTAHSGLASEISALHLEDPIVHQARASDMIRSLARRGAARIGLRL